MIVSFSVANFRSFSTEETLNLVASPRLGQSHKEHEIAIPNSDEKVLRTAVLYGANGAGKSNLFKALSFVKRIALGSRAKGSGTGREAFLLGSRAAEPSSFDLQLIADSKLYRFGFKADDNRITEEWLARIDGSKEKILYERVTDETGKVKVNVPGISSAKKLKALATVAGPQNQSFLATIHLTLEKADLDDQLRSILEWFENGLVLIGPSAPFRGLGNRLAKDDGFKEFASGFLKATSTGVDHLDVVKTEIKDEELLASLADPGLTSAFKLLKESKKGTTFLTNDRGTELRKDGDVFSIIKIRSMHAHKQGQEVALELADESDGTQRLLNLLPALYYPRNKGAAYFIDEIDRSLHPKLVFDFLKFFLRSCEGTQRQVIVTTHESNLLDLELLRRDEIWFAEKDKEAATRLYSLSDFKVRNDLEIRKHYLQGRFGAIPFLGNLARLLDDQGCPE
jgi:AAA15 family ATPase/GTPase